MPRYEFRCAKCAKVFIAEADESWRQNRPKCPICDGTRISRVPSVYSSVDLDVEPTEDEEVRERAARSEGLSG
jgi:putative FmdB family regulatory protein